MRRGGGRAGGRAGKIHSFKDNSPFPNRCAEPKVFSSIPTIRVPVKGKDPWFAGGRAPQRFGLNGFVLHPTIRWPLAPLLRNNDVFKLRMSWCIPHPLCPLYSAPPVPPPFWPKNGGREVQQGGAFCVRPLPVSTPYTHLSPQSEDATWGAEGRWRGVTCYALV